MTRSFAASAKHAPSLVLVLVTANAHEATALAFTLVALAAVAAAHHTPSMRLANVAAHRRAHKLSDARHAHHTSAHNAMTSALVIVVAVVVVMAMMLAAKTTLRIATCMGWIASLLHIGCIHGLALARPHHHARSARWHVTALLVRRKPSLLLRITSLLRGVTLLRRVALLSVTSLLIWVHIV